MREKKIEQKLVTAVKSMAGFVRSLYLPVSMECQTVYCFYRMAGLPLWKSKHQIRNQDPTAFKTQTSEAVRLQGLRP